MEITRSRAYKSNIDNYEAMDFFVAVKASHAELGYTDEEWLDLHRTASETEQKAEYRALHALVEEELEEQLHNEIALVNELRAGTRAKDNSVLGTVTE